MYKSSRLHITDYYHHSLIILSGLRKETELIKNKSKYITKITKEARFKPTETLIFRTFGT